MKKILFLLFTVAAVIQLDAQKETRILDDYDAIKVSGGISLVLHEGSPKAVIELKKGDMEDLVVKVKDNTLHIKFEGNGWFGSGGNGKAHIELYGAHNIEELSASAGSSVNTESNISAHDFDLSVSSGALVDIDLECSDTDVSVSSGGHVKLAGKASGMDVSVSSGGGFKGVDFECKDVDASASSGGAAKVWATHSIDASASSGGSVKYKGNPSDKDIDVGKYSGGSVSAL